MIASTLLRSSKGRRKRISVTVCVGAMASFRGDPILIGASDRMVTSGDIEFEQEQTKIFVLTKSVCIMVAGDLTIQADILHRVISQKNDQLLQYPDEWLSVKMVANWFYQNLSEITRKSASQAILEPLNLDFEKLTSPTLAPELANQLTKEVLQFQIASIQAIVMGIDDSGAHLYEVNNQSVACHDWTGFASIGAGAWHANSQLMFGEHVKSREMAETLMLVYTAKKRAEVAPGVGEKTDMIVIGPGLGVLNFVGEPIMGQLQDTHKRVKHQAQKVRAHGNNKISEYIEKTLRDAVHQAPSVAGEISSEHGSEESTAPTEITREKTAE